MLHRAVRAAPSDWIHAGRGARTALCAESLGDLGTDAQPLPHAANDDPAAKSLLSECTDHLARHPGKPATTVHNQLAHIAQHLAASDKAAVTKTTDIDAFLIGCAGRYARSTVADIAGSVRCFARFLLATGHISKSIWPGPSVSPVQPKFSERPRRAALGERAAPARRGHHLSARPTRLCAPADDERQMHRIRRGHLPASARHRLECCHAQDLAAEDRHGARRCRWCRLWPRRCGCSARDSVAARNMPAGDVFERMKMPFAPQAHLGPSPRHGHQACQGMAGLHAHWWPACAVSKFSCAYAAGQSGQAPPDALRPARAS